MAICGTCGAESARVRSVWNEDGRQPDLCPQCSPGSFEKFTAPSDKKIWMGYEAHPNEYVKAEDGGYDRKPEYRAEQEARLAQPSEEAREAQQRAETKKRADRRNTPMTSFEIQAALRQADELLNGQVN